MRLVMTSVLLAGAFAASAQAQSGVDSERLQVRCNEQASDYFDRAFKPLITAGVKSGVKKSFSYDSHYNLARRRCFALVSSVAQNGATDLFLKDVADDRMVGVLLSADKASCRVENRKCTSEKEFRALVRPLMEQ